MIAKKPPQTGEVTNKRQNGDGLNIQYIQIGVVKTAHKEANWPVFSWIKVKGKLSIFIHLLDIIGLCSFLRFFYRFRRSLQASRVQRKCNWKGHFSTSTQFYYYYFSSLMCKGNFSWLISNMKKIGHSIVAESEKNWTLNMCIKKALNHLGSSVCFVKDHSSDAADAIHFVESRKYVKSCNGKRPNKEEQKNDSEKSHINVISELTDRAENSRKPNRWKSYCDYKEITAASFWNMHEKKHRELHVNYS